MKKVFGLLGGNAKGPWIHTDDLKEPFAVVRGFVGGKLAVQIEVHNELLEVVELKGDGQFPLRVGRRMRFFFEGNGPCLQCLVVGG